MVRGSLSNFSVLEVLQFVGRKNGVLVIDAEAGTVRVFIRSGNVTGLEYNGERISDLFVARGVVFRFLGCTEGDFRYVPGEHTVGDFAVPVETFVLSVATFKDEVGSLPISNLVHPDTVYSLSSDVGEFPPSLRKFLDVTRPLLLEGASSRKISTQTGLDLETVRKYMTVLENAGYVRPRVASRSNTPIEILEKAISYLKRFFKWRR